MHRLLIFLLAAFSLLGDVALPAHADDGDFAHWAAVVIAGDWRSHAGGDTEAFDNTRKDVAAALVKAGFDPANVRQYSLRPIRRGDDPKIYVSPQTAMVGFETGAKTATAGCLFYVSSHGSPDGAVFGPRMILNPMMLKVTLDQVCGERPTVVIISACFSGVFVPALAGPNRMVLTAARPDRSSFGCGEADKYPYFDQCVLESLPNSSDFAVLGRTVQGCVAARETKEGMKPPSEPQLYIGAGIKPLLPLLALNGGARSPPTQTR